MLAGYRLMELRRIDYSKESGMKSTKFALMMLPILVGSVFGAVLPIPSPFVTGELVAGIGFNLDQPHQPIRRSDGLYDYHMHVWAVNQFTEMIRYSRIESKMETFTITHELYSSNEFHFAGVTNNIPKYVTFNGASRGVRELAFTRSAGQHFCDIMDPPITGAAKTNLVWFSLTLMFPAP